MEADNKVEKSSDIGFWKSLMLGGILGVVVNITQPTGAATEYLTYALIGILLLMLIRPKNKFLQARKSYGGLFAGVLVFMFISSGQQLGQQLHQTTPTPTGNVIADTPRIAAESHEYIDKDFYWDKNTTPWKAVIIKGVNKIHRENPRCTNLDPGSVDVSLSKGTKSNPVFYVTCLHALPSASRALPSWRRGYSGRSGNPVSAAFPLAACIVARLQWRHSR